MKYLRFMTMLLVAVMLTFTACEGENSGGSDSGTGVKVSGITLDTTNADIEKSKNTPLQLTETVTPADATNRDVNWTSSDTNVATVDQNGLVTAVNYGFATIIASTKDSGLVASCNITVSYALRDEGPAGGLIFSKVKRASGGWLYKEAAPEDYTYGSYPYDTIAYSTDATHQDARSACTVMIIGGKYDWYLPSIAEMREIDLNLQKHGVGNFGNNKSYWTSAEEQEETACYHSFDLGHWSSSNKSTTYRVRAVRTF